MSLSATSRVRVPLTPEQKEARRLEILADTARRQAQDAADRAVLAQVAERLALTLPGQGETWGLVESRNSTYSGRVDVALVLGLTAHAENQARNEQISRDEWAGGRFVDMANRRCNVTFSNYSLGQNIRGWTVYNRDGRLQNDCSPNLATAQEAVAWFVMYRFTPRDILTIRPYEAAKWDNVGGC